MNSLERIAKKYVIAHNIKLNRFYSYNGFRSTKNLRKGTINDYEYVLKLSTNQKIIGSYKGFIYYIYWKINEGITCNIFDDSGKYVAYSAYVNHPKETIEKNAISYINRMTKIIKEYEENNYTAGNSCIW